MAESHFGACIPQEPFRASSLLEYRSGSGLGAPAGRRDVGLSEALGQARAANAARFIRARRNLLPQAGADAAIEGHGCEPRVPGCSIRLLRRGYRSARLV